MSKKIKLTPFARNYSGEVRALEAGADGVRTYAITVSSELPVERVMFGRHSVEILSHEPGAVDMTRANGMPLLLEHDHSKQIGVVEKLVVANGRTEAIVRFSRSAVGADVERDVADGIRRNVSIGYRINEMEFEGVDGRGADIYRATNWMPYEVSIVSVPADHTVGVGRAAETDEYTATVNGKDDEEAATAAGNQVEQPAGEAPAEATSEAPAEAAEAAVEPIAEVVAEVAAAVVEATTEAMAPAETAEAPAATQETEQEAEREDETSANAPASHEQEAAGTSVSAPVGERAATQKDAADIVKLATKYGQAERVADFLQRGLTLDEVAQELLVLTRTNPTNFSTEKNMTTKTKKYSLARAMLVAAGVEAGGVEAQLSDELRNAQVAAGVATRGFLLPSTTLAERTMTAGTATTGAELVATDHGDLIQAIYDATVSSRLGVTFLNGLQGNVEFPREIPGLTAAWVGENTVVDVDESELAFGQLELGPKGLMASTSFSRQLLVQASTNVEALVRTRLAELHARKIDVSIFHGAGAAAKQPLGIYNDADVASVDLTDGIDHAKLVEMVGKLLAAGTLSDNIRFVMTPEVAAKLATTLKAPAAGSGFLWEGPLTNGTVLGYPAIATNLVSKTLGVGGDEHGIIVGDFSNVLVGSWGTLEIIGDVYSKKKQNLIEYTSTQFADVGLRHAAAFVKGVGLKV